MNILHHFVFLEENRNLDTVIPAHYDLGLVFLSILLAIFSCYVAFIVSRRIRSTEQNKYNLLWLWGGSLALGSGIWAMHFVGMLAYILPVAVNYDVTTTIISIIPAILSSLIVLKTSHDKNITAQSIFWRSVLMGSGIGLMHYIGMAAMLMNGIMRYDLWLLVFSFLIAIVLASISLRFKLQAEKHVTSSVIFSVKLFIPAVIMGCAISSMHYTGMAAMYVFPNSADNILTSAWSPDDLAKVISVITLLLGVLLLVVIEVSNRLDLYKKIKDSEQNLDMTLNSIGDAVISTDANGLVTRMNPVAERLTGWSLKEAQGQPLKTIFSIINASTREPIENPVDKVIATGETVYLSNHTTLISRSGTEYQITDSTAPIKDNDHILGMVLVFNDVTERYLKDEKLRRSQKMDALGKLTGGIAHDYNNMLGIILGYSELIEEMAHEQPELTEYINHIRHAGERGTKLTKKLLTFSRHQSSENKIVNLNTLLEYSQLMLEKTLTVRISLVYELEKSCWPINLDESDLEDAILNMSINAMHSIEGTGQLTFETRNEAIKEIDAHHLQIPAGDYVLLSITDTGCGMDNKTKENIFDPFFSTKGKFGTGLGLSQVYGFAQRAKGNVKIYSELGHGSRFTLYFPRYYESDIEEKQFKEADETNLLGNQTILVVDDEPALAKLTSHILTQQGYHVFIANSGKEALLTLEKEPVDVLVSDVIMPEMDGYELAAIVQEKYPNIKIQLASGFNDDRHVDNINASLHENLLHKPYHSEKLLLRIRELLKGSAD